MHPKDAELFAVSQQPTLRLAVAHVSYLLEWGYAPDATLKLVGDRFQLALRQRQAVARAACAEPACRHRRETQLEPGQMAGRVLWIDGFNVLNTLEVALSGGIVLRARDGCLRDIASVHGTWRRVQETEPALRLLVATCVSLSLAECRIWLDRPVSNSGRLRGLVAAEAERQGLECAIEVVNDPDKCLAQTDAVVATSDREILAACTSWFDLCGEILAGLKPPPFVVDLS